MLDARASSWRLMSSFRCLALLERESRRYSNSFYFIHYSPLCIGLPWSLCSIVPEALMGATCRFLMRRLQPPLCKLCDQMVLMSQGCPTCSPHANCGAIKCNRRARTKLSCRYFSQPTSSLHSVTEGTYKPMLQLGAFVYPFANAALCFTKIPVLQSWTCSYVWPSPFANNCGMNCQDP